VKRGDIERDIKDAKENFEEQQKTHEGWRKGIGPEKASLDKKLLMAKRRLRKLNQDIETRQVYLSEQEDTVDTAVANYNIRLTELQASIASMEREKDNHLGKLADLQEQEVLKEAEISGITKKAEDLQTFYEENVAKFRIELREVQANIMQAKAEHKKALEEGRAIMTKIAEKEKELTVKAQVLEEREAEQAQEAEYLRKKKVYLNQ
jgi:chromosome segregation ATPase